ISSALATGDEACNIWWTGRGTALRRGLGFLLALLLTLSSWRTSTVLTPTSPALCPLIAIVPGRRALPLPPCLTPGLTGALHLGRFDPFLFLLPVLTDRLSVPARRRIVTVTG
ncbi:unnamed protein product, partial [Lampetra planeri]